MAKAIVKFGLKNKFEHLLTKWAGRECTHIQVTETIDGQGNIIDRSESEIVIYAFIGNPGTNTQHQAAGINRSLRG